MDADPSSAGARGGRRADRTGTSGPWDVIVVGGGHAGTEAAAASARLGARTLLVTPDLSRIGQMSCNPAIGGIAKGIVAREVDALGGVMGRATDASRIQFRMLNRRKGPAVWGPRAQCDRALYPLAVRRVLDGLPHLELFQAMVAGLLAEDGRVRGVETTAGLRFEAQCVVVTAGTFLRGRIHVGGSPGVGAGRDGEAPSIRLAEGLEGLGLEVARFKTGTPPRIDGRSVDFDRLERQDGETLAYRFAAYAQEEVPEQRPCWIAWAGEDLQEVVRGNLARSALYGGEIAGRGPRYCPSIEDKVVRFPDAERHQVFLEPEGLHTTELYVNGLSTSLPAEVQQEFLRTIPGLEEVRMTKAGYAIEYDYFPPHQLGHTLELRGAPGLFLAGQVNGTTGYEEAAAQGVVAGANAALRTRGEAPLVLERDQAYIGVLIDDLVTRGVDEPYRLFTSRAEFRLLLRQDNAVRRLGPIARDRGLLGRDQCAALEAHLAREDRVRAWCERTTLAPACVNELLLEVGSSPIDQPARAGDLLKRPGVTAADLVAAARGQAAAGGGDAGTPDAGGGPRPPVVAAAPREGAPCQDEERGADPSAVGAPWPDPGDEALTAVEVEIKYAGYVERDRARARRLRDQAGFALAQDLDYGGFRTLSTEARQKLGRVRPTTLAQAARIPGVSPADVQNLVLEVKRHRARGTGAGEHPGDEPA